MQSLDIDMLQQLLGRKYLADLYENNIKFKSIIQQLGKQIINIQQLKKLTYQGLSNQFRIRGIAWRIFLGLLPLNKGKWCSTMQIRLRDYQILVNNLINIQNASTSDIDMWKKIACDSRRTRYNQILKLQKLDNIQGTLSKQSYNYDFLTRILYLFAKKNPQIGYCQGMNQIAGLIVLALGTNQTYIMNRYLQSDSYTILTIIYQNLIQYYSVQGDKLQFSITKIQTLTKQLKTYDYWLYQKLTKYGKTPLFIIKWLFAFSSLFNLKQGFELWDSLFSSELQILQAYDLFLLSGLVISRQSILEQQQHSLLIKLQQQGCLPISQLRSTALKVLRNNSIFVK